MLYDREIDNSVLIQFIILHTLNKAARLVAYSDLLNLVLENCNISYTDFQLSLDNLVRTKHVEALLTGSNMQQFRITEKGAYIAASVRDKVPVYIREPIEQAVNDLLREERLRNAVRGRISLVSPKEYTAECSLYDGDNTMLMTVSLYAGTREQAEAMVTYFKENPELVYEKMIEAFSPSRKEDTE